MPFRFCLILFISSILAQSILAAQLINLRSEFDAFVAANKDKAAAEVEVE